MKIFNYNCIQSIEVFFLPITYHSADLLLLAEIGDNKREKLSNFIPVSKNKTLICIYIKSIFAKKQVIAAKFTSFVH